MFPYKNKSTRKIKVSQKQRTQKSQERSFFLFLGFLCLLLFLSFRSPSIQGPINSESPQAFFEAMAPDVQKLTRGTGLFPSVVLAQAALESDFGRSVLAHDHHNYFGIKAIGYEAQTSLETKEYINGQWLVYKEPFRTYPSPYRSVQDYVKLLTSLDRYLIVLESQNPEEAAYALMTAGYATDPAYGTKLIQMIADYDLKRFDP